jgi:hypothetical protein
LLLERIDHALILALSIARFLLVLLAFVLFFSPALFHLLVLVLFFSPALFYSCCEIEKVITQ